MPSSTSTSITITTKFSQATTPRRSRCNPTTTHPLFFFASFSLHLPHFLPRIHLYFGGIALHQSYTCSLCLPPAFLLLSIVIVFILCVSALLSPSFLPLLHPLPWLNSTHWTRISANLLHFTQLE